MLRKIDLMYELFGRIDNAQCKNCSNLIMHKRNRNYYKCTVYGNSCSEATDWKISKHACGLFNKEYDKDITIVKLVRPDNKQDTQIDGQIGLF